jgi:hypothetical protein
MLFCTGTNKNNIIKNKVYAINIIKLMILIQLFLLLLLLRDFVLLSGAVLVGT